MDAFAHLADPTIIAIADDVAARIRARIHDGEAGEALLEGSIEDIRATGYLRIVVPARLGGLGGNIVDACAAQERVAAALGSAGLAANMHVNYTGGMQVSGLWQPERAERFLRGVAEHGWMINNVQAEAEMGSPARGGLPATTATRIDGMWRLNGRKQWSTAAPYITHYGVSATVHAADMPEHLGQFLVEASAPGVSIDPTWHALAMRESASHDIVFDDVLVPDDDVIRISATGETYTASVEAAPWHGLTFAATYLGIAAEARDWAVRFAATRRPTNLGTTIGELPAVRAKLGEIESLLLTARRMIYGVARDWIEERIPHNELAAQVPLVKYVATNNAVRITDLAMRVAGGFGMTESEPLERCFRDVRSGLVHPPIDDVALDGAAKRALREAAESP